MFPILLSWRLGKKIWGGGICHFVWPCLGETDSWTAAEAFSHWFFYVLFLNTLLQQLLNKEPCLLWQPVTLSAHLSLVLWPPTWHRLHFAEKSPFGGKNPFQKIVQGLFSQRLSPSKGWFMLPCLEVVTFLMLSPPVSPLFVKRAWAIFRHGMKPRPTPSPLLANVTLCWRGLGWRWKIHTTAIVWILKVPQRPMH